MTSGYFQISKIGQKYECREELTCIVNKHLREMSRDGHVLNGGINANFVRDATLKRSRGQRYVGLVILVSQNHWVGAKVHVTRCVDLYSGQILVFSMTLMTVCVLSAV